MFIETVTPTSSKLAPIEQRIQNEENMSLMTTRPRNEVVEGPIAATMLMSCQHMIRDLQISQARRHQGWNFSIFDPFLLQDVFGVI